MHRVRPWVLETFHLCHYGQRSLLASPEAERQSTLIITGEVDMSLA